MKISRISTKGGSTYRGYLWGTKIAIFIALLFILQISSILYGEEVRSCTHKQLNPSGGFICVGGAEPYQPPTKEELPAIPEIQRENWNLIDSLSIDRYAEPGKNYTIYFDNALDTLKIYPPEYEYPLIGASYQALDKAPEWLRNDLCYVLSRINSFDQNEWAFAINNAVDPYIDEIAFAIANSSPEYLASGYGSPDLFQENAELIYENDLYLDYVEVVDYGTSDSDENYYSTTIYWKEDDNGDTVQVEVPKEIYYWYIVHPKITDEIPAYIDPNIIESNTTHNNNIVNPPVGFFWRNYLFNYADTGYPVLKNMLEGCEIVWNGEQNVNPTQTHAAAVITNWINDCMEFTSDSERPHQPVRILRKHIGRCGELADLTAAASRAALIPCTSIFAISHDHTWNEFWEEGWVHWEPVNNYIDNPLSYENGWGWSFGSVFEIRSDGWISSVTGTYSDGSATITIYALDSQGNPIDGAEVILAVLCDPYIFTDNYGLTDNEGKYCFTVGEGRHYYARVDTDIGSSPPNPNQVYSVVNNTVNGQNYTYSLSVSGTMPSQIVSGPILMDDVSSSSQLYKKENDGIIDYFMTDDINYIWYLVGNPFDCFHLFSTVDQGFVTFDIPSYSDWYCVFANNCRLNNLQNICSSAKLYYYEPVAVDEQANEQNSFSLLQNYPNPFNGSTTIEYAIKGKQKDDPVEIRIYNIVGQLVETIEARNGIAVWYVDNLPTGIYLYKLNTENYNEVKKMLLIR